MGGGSKGIVSYNTLVCSELHGNLEEPHENSKPLEFRLFPGDTSAGSSAGVAALVFPGERAHFVTRSRRLSCRMFEETKRAPARPESFSFANDSRKTSNSQEENK